MKTVDDVLKFWFQELSPYPHRNQILSRASTQEETEFLKQEGSSF